MSRPEVTGRKLSRAGKTMAEFARSYNVTRRTLEVWIKDGRGPAITQPGGKFGRITITEQSEREWLAKHTKLAAAIAAAE